MMDQVVQPGIIEIAIEPRSKADNEKLMAALAELRIRRSTSADHESGQIILKGVSELQLDNKIDLLKHAYGIDARIGAPQVAFLERVTRRVEHSYTHKRQSGGAGQFAAVTLVVEPNEPGKGYAFESKIVDGAVPKQYVPGIEGVS
ncbi:translation elongation factor EF-G [Bradyrhizobium elkanii]